MLIKKTIISLMLFNIFLPCLSMENSNNAKYQVSDEELKEYMNKEEQRAKNYQALQEQLNEIQKYDDNEKLKFLSYLITNSESMKNAKQNLQDVIKINNLFEDFINKNKQYIINKFASKFFIPKNDVESYLACLEN